MPIPAWHPTPIFNDVGRRVSSKKPHWKPPKLNLKGQIAEFKYSYTYKDIKIEKGNKMVVKAQYGKGVIVEIVDSQLTATQIPVPKLFIRVLREAPKPHVSIPFKACLGIYRISMLWFPEGHIIQDQDTSVTVSTKSHPVDIHHGAWTLPDPIAAQFLNNSVFYQRHIL